MNETQTQQKTFNKEKFHALLKQDLKTIITLTLLLLIPFMSVSLFAIGIYSVSDKSIISLILSSFLASIILAFLSALTFLSNQKKAALKQMQSLQQNSSNNLNKDANIKLI
jgi:hypothetical protein